MCMRSRHGQRCWGTPGSCFFARKWANVFLRSRCPVFNSSLDKCWRFSRKAGEPHPSSGNGADPGSFARSSPGAAYLGHNKSSG